MLRTIIAFFVAVIAGFAGFGGVLVASIAIFAKIIFFLAAFIFIMELTSDKKRVTE